MAGVKYWDGINNRTIPDGSEGQQLTMTSGVPTWGAAGGSVALDDLTDVVITAAAQGELLTHNGTNWVDFAVGTSGLPLITKGAAANPVWEKLALANLQHASEAQGDILIRDGSEWTRLGVGTSGYFLKTQGAGANPEWAAGGGNISTVTLDKPFLLQRITPVGVALVSGGTVNVPGNIGALVGNPIRLISGTGATSYAIWHETLGTTFNRWALYTANSVVEGLFDADFGNTDTRGIVGLSDTAGGSPANACQMGWDNAIDVNNFIAQLQKASGGWKNSSLAVARDGARHRFKIVMSSTTVAFYLDDMDTPVYTETDTTYIPVVIIGFQCYVQNITSTGGNVWLYVWPLRELSD